MSSPDFQQRLEDALAAGDSNWIAQQGFPKVSFNEDDAIDEDTIQKITPEDGASEARSRSSAIFQHYKDLHDVLDRFEAIIRKRWAKKSREQRRQVLLKAWPSMARVHRPDLQAFRRESEEQRKSGTRFRDAYMWPSINLEDLDSGNALLKLLNSRGRHLPPDFALMDLQSTRIGRCCDAFPLVAVEDSGAGFNMGYEMNMCADKYGAIEKIRYKSVGDTRSHRFFAAEGLRVLEIQERILEFLVLVCQGVLADKNLKHLEEPVVSEPPPLSSPNSEWLSVANLATHSPYEAPPRIDLSHIKSLVEARVAEAQDHLWLMREDPAYFADSMGEWSEHSSEMVLDNRRKMHPSLGDPGKKIQFWNRTACTFIWQAHERVLHWRLVNQQLDQITKVCGGANSPARRQMCHDGIRKLKFFMETIFIPQLKSDINGLLPPSPPLRSLFQRIRNYEVESGYDIYPRSDLNMKDDLLWLFAHLASESTLPMDTLAMEFDKLLKDKAQKGRITSMVAAVFSDVGLIGTVESQLLLAFPQVYEKLDEKLQAYEDERAYSSSLNDKLRPLLELNRMISASSGLLEMRLGEYSDPTSGRFFYPINKRRNLETTQAMQEAERNLDILWSRFDNRIDLFRSKEARDGLRDLLPKNRQLLRTPDWVEPEPQYMKGSKQAVRVAITEGHSNVQLGFKDSPTPKYEPAIKSNKTKTRGTPHETLILDIRTVPQAEETSQDTSRKIVVKKRVFKVFSTLFYNESANDQPGEIAWTDFLHAMNICFVPQKLYGSVWQFLPRAQAVDYERAINFHEPHPSGKLAYRVARRYGRRLTRTYGLDASCFVME